MEATEQIGKIEVHGPVPLPRDVRSAMLEFQETMDCYGLSVSHCPNWITLKGRFGVQVRFRFSEIQN